MSLPEQLQKQVDEATKIVEEHYGQPAKTEPEVKAEEVKAAEPDATPSPAEKPAGEKAPPRAAEDENSQTYAQRWRSLQGVFNSQHAELQTALQRIQSLEGVIAMMQVTPAAQSESQKPSSYLTDKDREEYGDELIDFTVRAVRQENQTLARELEQTREQLKVLGNQFQQLQGSVVPTVQRVAQTQQQAAHAAFFQALTARMPNWEQVNASPEFHKWLLQPDPMTNIIRQTYLEAAQSERDVNKVLAIFNAFKPVTGTPSAPAARKTPVSELERQVAPGRSLAAPAPSANEARKWTRDDIRKLYDDNRRGAFRGKEAEFKALERDLFAAQHEGRMVA